MRKNNRKTAMNMSPSRSALRTLARVSRETKLSKTKVFELLMSQIDTGKIVISAPVVEETPEVDE